MTKCCDCTTTLSRHNSGIRCFQHAQVHEELKSYVEKQEIKAVGIERWSAGQTTKRNTRIAYVRELAKKRLHPWDSSLEELYLVDPRGVHTLMEHLFEEEVTRSDLEFLDHNLKKLMPDEVEQIEIEYPASNIKTKYVLNLKGERYVRFRSPIDELK